MITRFKKIVVGTNCSAAGTSSTCSGGRNNAASGSISTVGGGRNNTASGYFSTVGGGYNNTASGYFSTVGGGKDGVASQFGQRTYSSGKFLTQGDAQASSFVLRGATTNATPTNLYLDGLSIKLAVESSKMLSFVVNISGIQSDGSNAAQFFRRGVVKNVGGTTSLVDSIQTVGTDIKSAGASAWDVTLTANDTDDTLDIQVTGASATNIRWVASLDAVDMAYA